MNPVNSKKLLNSKWTAVSPKRKEKHFMVVEVAYDEDGAITECLIEAVITGRTFSISWQDLKDERAWLVGWQ